MTPDIANLEGVDGFDVTWPWSSGALKPGLTAVLRVRNEARNLPWVLPSIMAATDHVLLVDNQSTDGTPELALELGRGGGLEVLAYPFEVARCGPEHLGTPATSVHSLTHYYNWAFAHVGTRWSMKWDGDMVLTREGIATVADLSWQLGGQDAVVLIPRHPLNVESDRVAYLDLGMRGLEPWIYPMRPEYAFLKAFEWELRDLPETVDRMRLRRGLCVELKWLDSDEFDHWTSVESFGGARTPRKQREWEVFTACREGRWQELDQVVRIESPPGVHVIDYVVDTWLPGAAPAQIA
jgi:glycosyltransferase involved in cell wall biosynthesis